MYCTNCGLELKEIDRFCSQCGKGTGQERPAQPQGYYAPRRVYRLMYDKKVGGVCAGLAKYFDLDVTLVRILVLCAALMSGGIVALGYLIAWIVMPKDYGSDRPAQAPYTGAGNHAEPAPAE